MHEDILRELIVDCEMNVRTKGSDLIDQVHQAFLDVLPPADESGVVISYSGDTERKDLARFLRSKHWSEVTFETIRDSYDHQASAILLFLTEDGFHYFFPAFLPISLRLVNTELDDHLLESTFAPFARLYTDNDKFYQDRVDRFTLQQLQVTKAVFEYIREERRQEIVDEMGYADSKVISIELEVLENAINGVNQAIIERAKSPK
jgi:hypothetical protein